MSGNDASPEARPGSFADTDRPAPGHASESGCSNGCGYGCASALLVGALACLVLIASLDDTSPRRPEIPDLATPLAVVGAIMLVSGVVMLLALFRESSASMASRSSARVSPPEGTSGSDDRDDASTGTE